MNKEQLLDIFSKLAEHPDSIPHVRRLILDMAIRGNLVKANELIDLRNSQTNRQRVLPSMPTIPLGLPSTQLYVNLSTVAYIKKGTTGIKSANPGPYPLVTLAEEHGTCDQYQFDTKAAIIPLISSTGHGDASIKRLHYQEGKFALGNILCAVIPISPQDLSARFLYEYLSAYKEELLVSNMVGTANVSLNIAKIGQVPIPIVTPAAQHCAEELMALCDQLEAAQREREVRRDQLVASSLHSVVDSEGEDTKENTRFYINQLPRMTARLEHINQLRDAVLDLAVRGKLVPQNPTDEPAEKLLEKIKAKKAQSKVLQKPPNSANKNMKEELPFTLPSGWAVECIESLAMKLGAGSTPLGGKSTYKTEGIRFIRSQNVYDSGLKLDDVALISNATHHKMSGTHIQENDILINITGASIGRCALVPSGFGEGNVSQHVAIVRLVLPEIREFVHLLLISPAYQKRIRAVEVGVSREGLSMQQFKKFPIALPPLAEQNRIILKVKELTELCDQLETRLSHNLELRASLLEATLHEALQA